MITYISERDRDVDEHMTIECAISFMYFFDSKNDVTIKTKITKKMQQKQLEEIYFWFRNESKMSSSDFRLEIFRKSLFSIRNEFRNVEFWFNE